MDANEMRKNGDTEPSIKYWATQVCYWNGQPVTVSAPQPINPPSAETGD